MSLGWLTNIHVLGKEKEGTCCLYKAPFLGGHGAGCCDVCGLGGMAPVTGEETDLQGARGPSQSPQLAELRFEPQVCLPQTSLDFVPCG